MCVRLNMDLERRLLRDMGRAIGNHHLIEEGDRIMVAISGGKDSYGLLVLLRALQARAPVSFQLLAVHLDQGQPGYDGAPLERWLQAEGVPYKILRENTYAIVTDKIPEGKTYCSLCSRLRRGILYRVAGELGCNKIALGHHRDDALETLLLNLFFGGKLASMPPRLVSDDGRFVVIRPLAYAAEADLTALAEQRGFPILPCRLCGSQDEAQRKQMKALLADLERKHPTLRQTMLAAIGNVVPSHLYGRSSEIAGDDASLPGAPAPSVETPLIAATSLLR
jgi:tRNA 2-thiocytidine biosynthesis protein TtcA